MTNAPGNLNAARSGACPVCGGTGVRLLGKNPDFPKSEIIQCRGCGYIWSRPEPTPAELEEVYRAAYRNIRQESPTPNYLAFMDARAKAQHDFIRQTVSRDFEGMEVLEIGCGAGSLLKVIEQHGATVTGFEPDIAMSRAARSRLSAAARIENAMFAATERRSQPFDLICLSHVLEHIPKPIHFLADLKRAAKPGGWLFLEVPNETRNSVRTICKYRARGLMHLSFFNAGTLRRSVTMAGWTPKDEFICGEDIAHWMKALRRNYSLVGRVNRKWRRILEMAGLAGNIVSREAEQIEWLGKRNPNGTDLRAISQVSA